MDGRSSSSSQGVGDEESYFSGIPGSASLGVRAVTDKTVTPSLLDPLSMGDYGGNTRNK